MSSADTARHRQPLGSPHDGYAAVLLTLSIAVALFGVGAGRQVQEHADAQLWQYLPLVLLPVYAALIYASSAYFVRAHGGNLRQGLRGPAMPMLALFLALWVIYSVVIPVLANSLGVFGYAAACMALATLLIGPAQYVLSKDPQKHSTTT